MMFLKRFLEFLVCNEMVIFLYAFELTRNAGLDGKLCAPLFTANSLSLVQCAVICLHNSTCKSQFFKKSTSTCIGCTEGYYESDETSLTEEQGTVFFGTPTAAYGEKCSDLHRPCAEEHNVCFLVLEKCVCNPRTSVYSESTRSCVTDCTVFGTTFQMYPRHALNGHNIGPTKSGPVEICTTECSSGTISSGCFSFDYDQRGFCMFNSAKTYDVPTALTYRDPSYQNLTIYIRNCQ